jgi:NAD(P)-dependent dehydrogenase (short-subunit alcohol dehydrogenase family)
MAHPRTVSPSQFSALKDKVTIVTGASSGIGWATSKLFAENGAIVINADLIPPLVPIDNVEFARCDVTNWGDLLATFEKTMDRYKSIDVLVANAGIGEVEDLFLDRFDETTRKLLEPDHVVVKVNLLGTLNCVKLAVHFMQRNEHHAAGSIIMISSTAGILGEACLPAYSATKHAVCLRSV